MQQMCAWAWSALLAVRDARHVHVVEQLRLVARPGEKVGLHTPGRLAKRPARLDGVPALMRMHHGIHSGYLAQSTCPNSASSSQECVFKQPALNLCR